MNEEDILPAPARSLPLKKAFRRLSNVLTILPKRTMSDDAIRFASQTSLESKFFTIPTDAAHSFRSHWILHESLGTYDRLLAAQLKGGTACYFVYQVRLYGKIRTVVRWVYLWLDEWVKGVARTVTSDPWCSTGRESTSR
ncbi:MAG: uncharacterized protein KVP18_000161 [Porospora cf. gigantea A]|uniref:uncharacterized protein n=1 Tax=Porospora cf. gigantea A TaxID=2853593 RepID=UPI00355A809F|nr:MAG: hypothetical protein KVP18_000161 [Porospora cf. gigantea A]